MTFILEQAHTVNVPITAACAAFGRGRATLYRVRARRRVSPLPRPVVVAKKPHPRRLSEAERAAVLATMHSAEFVDQPPREVYAELLGRGVYLASIRTIYRILKEAGETTERRNQRAPAKHVKPSVVATAPNQVWTWDISVLQKAA